MQPSLELTQASKLIVGYLTDRPHSELPPGHWGLFVQFVSQCDRHSIDLDAKMFFAMHDAIFDAGSVGCHLKHKYDGARPITAIRFLRKERTVMEW